jgi:DNA polymerase-3 subunit alpha
MGALRGLGAAAVGSIIETRDATGVFTALFDLAERVDLKIVGKRSLEALIQAGACDRFGHRAQMMAGLETIVREAQLRNEEKLSGQGSLFDFGAAGAQVERPAPMLPDVPRWSESERLTREKEIVGFFITGHPLARFRDELRVFGRVTTSNLKQFRDQKIELPCVVTGVSRQVSRRTGAEWARLTVEDFSGTCIVLAFGESWDAHHDMLSQDTPVLIKGTVSGRDRDEEEPPIFLDGVVRLESLRTSGALAVEVTLEPGQDGSLLDEALPVFGGHPGPSPLFVRWQAGNGHGNGTTSDAAPGEASGNGGSEVRTATLRSRSIAVTPSEDLVAKLRELFGDDRIRLVRT